MLVFEFNQFASLLTDLCNGDDDRDIKFEFFKSSKRGVHQNLGGVCFTISDIRNTHEMLNLEIFDMDGGKLTFK
jgi:hypothetical protein